MTLLAILFWHTDHFILWFLERLKVLEGSLSNWLCRPHSLSAWQCQCVIFDIIYWCLDLDRQTHGTLWSFILSHMTRAGLCLDTVSHCNRTTSVYNHNIHSLIHIILLIVSFYCKQKDLTSFCLYVYKRKNKDVYYKEA